MFVTHGERISIKFATHNDNNLMPGDSKVLYSKIRWCKRIPRNKEIVFGIGVKFNKQ